MPKPKPKPSPCCPDCKACPCACPPPTTVVEDVTIEIPEWDDFYGFSTNTDPRTVDGAWGYATGNPSPIDASLFAGWNPLGQSFDSFTHRGWGYNGMNGSPATGPFLMELEDFDELDTEDLELLLETWDDFRGFDKFRLDI